MPDRRKVIVIGAGFSGLSAASILSKNGYDVTVLEKNDSIGGRARKLEESGFIFDMGPSWYWMPEVFERYFKIFNKSTTDFYELQRLDPSYRIWWGKNDFWNVPAQRGALEALFEEAERGGAKKLVRFLKEAQFKYHTSMGKFVFKPGKSFLEYFSLDIFFAALRIDLFTSASLNIRKFFSHPRLIQLLEFPVLFLGGTAKSIPALYSLMNYADLVLGTWYPMGGLYKVIEAFETVALSQGVEIITNAEVSKILVDSGYAKGVYYNDKFLKCDVVASSADYHHTETQLLEPAWRKYSLSYWNNRKLAPSCLLYYIGVKKRLVNLEHHNLFFDTSFVTHANQIYENPAWPSDPLFYASVTSLSDETVAPPGCENLFILVPVAPGLTDTQELREKYFIQTIKRMEQLTGQEILQFIIYRKDYASHNFVEDYHAFKGNAYGLANTLFQTGPLKPSMVSRKVKNLVFMGQLTVPGPGVPPSIISGELAAKEIMNIC